MSPSLFQHSTHIPTFTTVPSNSTSIHMMLQCPTELLIQICGDLHKIQLISELRLVNRQFHELATPVYYRHVTLTDRLISAFSSQLPQSQLGVAQSKFACHMQEYTQNLFIESLLECDCRDVLELLASLKRLRSIKSVSKHCTTVLC